MNTFPPRMDSNNAQQSSLATGEEGAVGGAVEVAGGGAATTGREPVGFLELPPLDGQATEESLGQRCVQFIIDTTVVYVYGMTRLAVAQMFVGAICIGLGISLFWINDQDAWAGVGIWAGIPIFSAGIVCLYYRKKRPLRKFYFHSLSCFLAILASSFLIVSSGINLMIVGGGEGDRIYPNYYNSTQQGDEVPLMVANSLLCVTSTFGTLCSSFAFTLCINAVCCCCQQARDRIYTISYDDDVDPQLTSDKDFMIDPNDHKVRGRRAPQPVLSIQEPEYEYDEEYMRGSNM